MTSFKKYFRDNQQLLSEAKLQPADLSKPISGWKNRGEVLLNKIVMSYPLELEDGSSSTVYMSDGDIEELKQMIHRNDFTGFNKRVQLYKLKDNKPISLSAIKKTVDFGGGVAGSGAGAELTKFAESAAAIISAYMVKVGNYSGPDIHQLLMDIDDPQLIANEFEKASSNFDVTKSPLAVANWLLTNDTWFIGTCLTAAAIIGECDPSKSVVFHRGSTLMGKIYSRAQSLLSNAGIKLGNDKWNPGDIWLIDKGSDVFDKLMSASSIREMNSILQHEAVGNRGIVGISLKSSGGKMPPAEWYNIEDTRSAIIDNIDEIKLGFFDNIVITKDVNLIKYPKITMQIRDFANKVGAGVQGEIKGEKAAGGKIGHVPMTKWIKSNTGKTIDVPSYNDIVNKDDTIKESFVKKFYDVISEIYRFKRNIKIEPPVQKLDSIEDINQAILELLSSQSITDVASRLASKYQGLQIALYSNSEFFDYAYTYASSSTSYSSPFLKIGR